MIYNGDMIKSHLIQKQETPEMLAEKSIKVDFAVINGNTINLSNKLGAALVVNGEVTETNNWIIPADSADSFDFDNNYDGTFSVYFVAGETVFNIDTVELTIDGVTA